METIYKVEFDFDTYKNVELMIECFMTISTIFSKCLKIPFSLSFPSMVENEGWTNCIMLQLKSSRPIMYEEYKSLSDALYKLSWSCFIEDQETNIKTIIRKEHLNMENELIIGDFL